MESILKVDNLNYAYKDRIIFENLSLNIKKSEWVCICGCNGCGKSTLIKILTGIIKTDENITVCNYNLKMNLYDVRRNIGVVFSDIDNMFSDELIANLFRISQTEQKLKNDNVQGENNCNITHYEIGKNIRNVIKKNGGTMPEKMERPNKSLKELKHKNILK